ncbi:PKD domain-containing protein [Candidatus Nitrosocosmicus franklandus]|uniref:PKD/Chitinase domain-containing protein n=1 Tax=Candidatus Nitrosocosmicus franklandianus TaxID=1798806 RepID=A0A484I736_9ARCH|nr:hypothetical protein [Candidatus Nitrosocosmicus franklandus]VFJ12609.1 protein of unknown function [Candidatus Nitrosocosmicus franklandus]
MKIQRLSVFYIVLGFIFLILIWNGNSSFVNASSSSRTLEGGINYVEPSIETKIHLSGPIEHIRGGNFMATGTWTVSCENYVYDENGELDPDATSYRYQANLETGGDPHSGEVALNGAVNANQDSIGAHFRVIVSNMPESAFLTKGYSPAVCGFGGGSDYPITRGPNGEIYSSGNDVQFWDLSISNSKPISNDRVVQPTDITEIRSGTLVTIDQGYSDSDNDPIYSTSMIQTKGPAVNLTPRYLDDSYQWDFVAPNVDEKTTLQFKSVVNDAFVDSNPNFIDIVVNPKNSPPETSIIVLPSNIVSSGEFVTLDGRDSFDPDPGDSIASYRWDQVSGPPVSLSGANSPIASFTAPTVDRDTSLSFSLTVADTHGASTSEAETIIVNPLICDEVSANTISGIPNIPLTLSSVSSTAAAADDDNCPPVADAGTDQRVNSGSNVELNGLGSTPAGEITFRWTPVTPFAPPLKDPNTAAPSFMAPYVDREETFVYQLVVNDGKQDSKPDTVSVTVLPLIIEITSNRDSINPYAPPATNTQPGDATARLTVSVKNTDNQPVPNENVRIKACTIPSTLSHDGHENHDNRNDKCNIGPQGDQRPAAFLNNARQPMVNNVIQGITLNTNNLGIVQVDYESPKRITASGTTVYISGQDDVIASLVETEDANHNTPFHSSVSIDTRVLDTNDQNNPLQPIANSQRDNCPPAFRAIYPQVGNYFFQKQDNHGCEFYGTQQTNNAIMAIAQEFIDRQQTCSQVLNFARNPDCRVDQDPIVVNNRVVQQPEIPVLIRNVNVPVKITAMNLGWGGLSDVNGHWINPHVSHNSGKEVDIGFLNRNGAPMTDNHKLLLREVIRDNNYGNQPTILRCEGGNNLLPVNGLAGNGCTEIVNGRIVPLITDHIHVNFAN